VSETSVNARRRTIVEVVVTFTLASAAAAVLYHAQAVPFIRRNLHALVAFVFLLLPQLVLRKRGNIERYGFTAQPLGLGLTIAALATLVILPVYAAGFIGAVRFGCAHAPELVPGSCATAFHPHWHLPPDFALSALAQLLVVALPEEILFRGYLQGRLEEALPPTVSLFGARVGWAWIIAAALFGLGHSLVTFEPEGLLRFFPGLVFGWMFARTRSVLASTLFHAACNLMMAVIGPSVLS
jgi:membrane protease YdiL (CAAX protease family)